jgi:hypothetical protein
MSASGQYAIAGTANAGNNLYYSINSGQTWTVTTYSATGNWYGCAISANGQYVLVVNAGVTNVVKSSLPFLICPINVVNTLVNPATSLSLLAPNIIQSLVPTTTSHGIIIGQAASTYNAFQILYNHVGVGSTANYMSIGTYNDVANVININAAGYVSIGKNNPVSRLDVAGSISVAGNISISGNLNGVVISGTTYNNIYTTSYDGAAAGINTNNLVISSWQGIGFGDASNNSYATAFINCRTGFYYGNNGLASDIRIKKNIITSSNALSTINKINVVSYDHIEQSKGSVQYGVIAQEIESILPEAISFADNYIGDCDKYVYHVHNSTNDVIIITCNNHGYNTNDNLRFTNDYKGIEDDKFYTADITVIDNNTFTIPSWKEYDMTKNLYIYGKHIKQFYYVDKSHFGILAISGIKEQNTIIQQQAEQIASLIQRLAAAGIS